MLTKLAMHASHSMFVFRELGEISRPQVIEKINHRVLVAGPDTGLYVNAVWVVDFNKGREQAWAQMVERIKGALNAN